LIFVNAIIAFFYFWRIFHYSHPKIFAASVIAMSTAYFIMIAVVKLRRIDDEDLQAMLLTIGLGFFIAAMPFIFDAYVLSVIWAAEGVMLAVIALRYKSVISQIAAAAAILLAAGNLFMHLPMHDEQFHLIFNGPFVSWIFVAVCAYAAHLVYRKSSILNELNSMVSQIYYLLFCAVIFLAGSLEWYSYCEMDYFMNTDYYVPKGLVVIASVTLLLLIVRPLCPAGKIRFVAAWIAAAAGSALLLVSLIDNEASTPVFNIDFLIPAIFLAVMVVFYSFHRFQFGESSISNPISAQFAYALVGILFFIIISNEWRFHWGYNFYAGQLLIFAIPVLFFLVGRIRPVGHCCNIIAAAFAVLGSVFAVFNFYNFYEESFTIFFNIPMLTTLIYVGVLAVSAYLLRSMGQDRQLNKEFASGFGILIIFLLWILLTEQIAIYWKFKGSAEGGPANWKFLAHMYVSVMWAFYGAGLMVIGVWKRVGIVRYLALGLFALLLAKVFIIDTSEIESVYRVAGFLATGITLVAVSYLYQYLKKKNFFDTVLTEKPSDNSII
jgi:uncharacterized membrane protein